MKWPCLAVKACQQHKYLFVLYIEKYLNVDQGVLPFFNYLYIDLIDLIRIRCVDCTDPLGSKHGKQKGNQLLSVLSIGDGKMIC